jgi:transcription antitermination factor NusG
MSFTANFLTHEPGVEDPLSIVVPHSQAQWYAGQTCARHEKSVAKQMDRQRIEHFLPFYEKVSRWKDRHVRLQLPLFPGYIFVRIALRDRLDLLQIHGVVRLVSFNGHPTALSEAEMSVLQRGLASGLSVAPYPFFKSGQLVMVRSGPLAGLTGYLVRRKQKNRIVISFDSIMRSFVAEVSLDDIEILSAS